MPVSALRGIGDGIEALRLFHDKIYQSDGGLDRMCLGTYLAESAANLLAFHGGEVLARIRLVSDIEHLEVTSDTAIPFGLITSEFITNSLKYAFSDGPGVIGLREEDTGSGAARVRLWDDDKGLPAKRSGGTGVGLIGGPARQVGASTAWSGEDGTRLVLSMPAQSAGAASVQRFA